MTASRNLVSFTTQRTTGHSVPCNCHTHQGKKAFLKCLFSPSKRTGYGVWFASLQRQSLNMGGGKRQWWLVVCGRGKLLLVPGLLVLEGNYQMQTWGLRVKFLFLLLKLKVK